MNVLVTGSASGFAQPFISPAYSSTARADITIDEQYARGAVPGCAAAEALQAVEAWLDVFEAEHPVRRLVSLRPHWLVGPHADSVLARLLRQRLSLRQSTPTQLQCAHEEDVVEAILRALHGKVRDAFNLACNESVTLTALHQQARWLLVPMAAHLLAHRLDTAREIIRHR